MSTSNKNKGNFLTATLEVFGNWLVKHAKIVMPVVLALCVIVTVVISVNANKKEAEKQEDIEANSTLENEEVTDDDDDVVVPAVPLQENDNPQITELINKYYEALVTADIDTIRTLVDHIDDKEILQIEETSKYIESYPTLEIYTKAGPLENTYLVYVCTEVKFTDYDEALPGMRVRYVCVDDDGRYFINESEEGSENELNYISEVTLQDDVVDLNNKIAAAYNDMVAADVDLAQFILDMNEEIDKNVGEALAQAKGNEESGEDADAAAADENAGETEGEETVTVVTKVKAIDVVNIRSSDSETADKLGKAAIGDEFKLIEKIGNGWSKIEYEGGDGYIKSEFLEDVETTEVAADTTENEEEATEPEPEQAPSSNETNGTVTVKETVRVRASASENGEKLGTAYEGDKLELIMKQADGWTKIKYNGQTAYVKSDYVE